MSKTIDGVILQHFKENYEDLREIITDNGNLHLLDLFTIAIIEEDESYLEEFSDLNYELFTKLLEFE